MTVETAKSLCLWKAHDPQETSPRSLSRTMKQASFISSIVQGGGKRRGGKRGGSQLLGN